MAVVAADKVAAAALEAAVGVVGVVRVVAVVAAGRAALAVRDASPSAESEAAAAPIKRGKVAPS